jgi:AraC-like DNA-binding protein
MPNAMLNAESTLASVWLIIFRLGELHGLDPMQLMAELGIRPETLRDVRARISARLADIAFAKLSERIADPAFALRAGECWHPSYLGTMGFAWLSSRTLHTGLRRMERFSRIIGSDFTYHLIDKPAGLCFVHDHGRGDDPIGHPMTDFTLSVLLTMCRSNYGHHLNVQLAHLRRPPPANPAPWQDFFNCEVNFGAAFDGFLLDWETVDRPLPSANIPLANTFDAILAEQMAAVVDSDLISRIKSYLLSELTSGVPSATELAGALGMSQRSLQRKLAERGLTYKKVLDEIRYELARRYLEDINKSVTEIAFLLGFSEQSAFTRAFRHWSGMSPSVFRGERLT